MNNGDTSDTTPNEWTGMYFKTVPLGTNPLMASYQGYPHMVRGTDPATAATDAIDWTKAGMQSAADAATGFPLFGASDFFAWIKDKFSAFAIGATGVSLGLLVVGIGLIVLLTTDAGKTALKAAA